MKKILKKMTAFLTTMLMMFSSISTVSYASAADGEMQPRTWYVYGDINNDGHINVTDLVSINKAIKTFNDLTGSSKLPLEYAVARPVVYFSSDKVVPQAADIDGDNYITDNDADLITNYVAMFHDKAGRCGQPFFIN